MRIGNADRSLAGKVVVVTGASAGIGRSAAVAFGARGAKVALLARGTDALKAARHEVEATGRHAIDLRCDVADEDAVDAAADAVESELGPIDVWVNNAMVGVLAGFTDIDPADFRRVTDVTYLGCVNGTRAALRRMLPRDRGTILQVGSALAFRGIPLQSAYCGAKHAIEGFTESVRCELLHRGSDVRITEVHLSAVNTPQFDWVRTDLPRHPRPVPPVYQPEVAAEGIVWAAEHPRRRVYVGASTVSAVWANRFLPGLLDRYLAKTGYEAQQAPWPIEGHRRDNLYEPVSGGHAIRGAFDEEARTTSAQLWATTHRGLLLGGGAMIVGGLATFTARRRRRT
jgi:NAD(P)-dependent dehydrogenase (short-subunit alcohol dehydrogenase family)